MKVLTITEVVLEKTARQRVLDMNDAELIAEVELIRQKKSSLSATLRRLVLRTQQSRLAEAARLKFEATDRKEKS